MRLKNEIFLHVLDWLHFNKNVRDQAHLAEIIGIDATSMSRIITGKNDPSEKTLRKLNEAFGNIFNMDYLRGKVPYPMLVSDLSENPQKKEKTILQCVLLHQFNRESFMRRINGERQGRNRKAG